MRFVPPGKLQSGQDGRYQVHGAHRPGVDLAGRQEARATQQEGDADRGVVNENGVRLLAVLSEALAMIGGDDDQGVVENPELAELVEDPAHRAVEHPDLGVVRGGRQQPFSPRDPVRLMSIEEMHPEKERTARPRRLFFGPAVQPFGSQLGGLPAGPRTDHEELRLVLRPEIVVVAVEALRKVVTPVEHQGRHKSLGAIAGPLQTLGQGDRIVTESIGAVVPDAVSRRIETGEDRRVRREGDGRRGDRVGAAHPLVRQSVHARSMGEHEAVGPQMIGPRRVQSDEEHVERRPGTAGKQRREDKQKAD